MDRSVNSSAYIGMAARNMEKEAKCWDEYYTVHWDIKPIVMRLLGVCYT